MQGQALLSVECPLVGPIPQQPLGSHGVLHVARPMQRRAQLAITGFNVGAVEQQKVEE